MTDPGGDFGLFIMRGLVNANALPMGEVDIFSPREYLKPEGEGATVSAVIDTGSNRTCVRPDVAKRLQLPILDEKQAVKLAHESAEACVSRAAIRFIGPDGGRMDLGIQTVLIMKTTEQLIVGMDLLDGGVLVVDRVRQTWKWAIREASR